MPSASRRAPGMLMNDDDGGASFDTAARRGNPVNPEVRIRYWDYLGILSIPAGQGARVKKLSMKILHKL